LSPRLDDGGASAEPWRMEATMLSSRSIFRAAPVAAAVLGLAGCYYAPPPPGYGYGYAPAYYYGGPYYYGPPVVGSVFVRARFR